jgi:uncharacterized membrane protein
MVSGLAGWHIIILLVYVVVIAAAVVGLYFLVRGAVLSALKAHTRWVDNGKA